MFDERSVGASAGGRSVTMFGDALIIIKSLRVVCRVQIENNRIPTSANDSPSLVIHYCDLPPRGRTSQFVIGKCLGHENCSRVSYGIMLCVI